MTVPQQDAANALQSVEIAQQRSAIAYQYQRFSSHLFIWGVIWMIGYAVPYFRPGAWAVWLALIPIGIVAGISLNKGARRHGGLSHMVNFIALFLFITAVFAILPPKSQAQTGAFVPLLVALFYVLFGSWTNAARIVLLGFLLGALTVGGFFWLPQYFLLWMAGFGGGALILGGFWLRRI